MSLTLSVSKTLPKLASKKLLKKAAPTANEAQTYCLAVLVDDETNLIGNFKGLEAYQQRIENLIAVSDFKGKLGETVTDFALSADAKKGINVSPAFSDIDEAIAWLDEEVKKESKK